LGLLFYELACNLKEKRKSASRLESVSPSKAKKAILVRFVEEQLDDKRTGYSHAYLKVSVKLGQLQNEEVFEYASSICKNYSRRTAVRIRQANFSLCVQR